MQAIEYLRLLCEQALPQRYPDSPIDVQTRLTNELAVIESAHLANYFLIVWDIVRYAQDNHIRCQGRGSAANSIVAYLLGITPIDPLSHQLVFERFLSDERRLTPDIDIDFQADRREEVIQYIYERYGSDHAAMACTLVTFRTKSALRDVGKALGLPLSIITSLSKSTDTIYAEATERPVEVDMQPDTRLARQFLDLCEQIKGFPRHLGIHSGGMVITQSLLSERLPTEPATMTDRVVVQWDKQGLEDSGLVKIDILGLRMLSAIAEAVDTIETTTGERPDLDQLSFDDRAIYEMITCADTVGIFQVESRAQAQILPQLRPQNLNDLIISISLIRPGPVQANMVHPYLRRRLSQEPVTYLHPALGEPLSETLGIILFQEQVLKVAEAVAGFTRGQGELLRRALGSKDASAEIERFHQEFIVGAQAKRIPHAAAETIFDKLRAFAGYSFPKSHAAAFAVLVYQSAWLKYYHAAAFYTALLNHQPMGFWTPAVLVQDAKRHGIEVRPVNINISGVTCVVEASQIRLGFNYIKGLGAMSIQRIVEARADKPFVNLIDFCRQTKLPHKLVEKLILVGAMDEWDLPRRKLLWELASLNEPIAELDLEYPDDEIVLPPLLPTEVLKAEYQVLGLSLSGHPMELYRNWLEDNNILSSHNLLQAEKGSMVRVAGMKVVQQSPKTAKGHVFLTLEDEDGFINVIIRPDVYERHHQVIRGYFLLMAKGVVQRKNNVINLLAHQITPLS